MAPPASSAQPRKGSTTRPRPSASNTTAMSKPAPPKPPSASANSAPMTPRPANWRHSSGLWPAAERAMRSRVSNGYCSATKRPIMSASMRRSSVCSKFIVGASQAQDRLGDDVALDFVGAAEDRQLAVVEVLHCGTRRGGRPDRLALEALFERLFDEGLRVRP